MDDVKHLEYDAVIIGGGPAGAATAAILAEKGRRVIILEKAKFPRYKIGESLIPYCYFPLERLGMVEKLNQSHFVDKHSVQFVSKRGKVSQPFYFYEHTKHPCAKTWQVLRSEFDVMMLDNALEKGAEVLHETAARELIHEGDQVVGVRARGADGQQYELRAPVTVDASGRESFAVKAKGWRVDDPQLKKIAVWSYFRGAKRDPGMDEGATTVAFVPEKGWFWYIPLPDDMVSVGVVAERDYLYRGERDPEAIYQREIDIQPWIKQYTAVGERAGDVQVTGDYSYRAKHCASDGLVLVGDAFAFLDPVFSSGVFLALQSGVVAADTIDAALKEGDVSAERFTDYGESMCQGLEAMRRLVYAFYDEGFSWAKLFEKYPHLREDATDCLIGHLWKDFDPLFDAVSEFAEVPEPLPHGRPLVTVT
ncbi:MAG: NAD(P)/FAD-dependent oxidoreductase [Phycisphaeraceae bacterium]